MDAKERALKALPENIKKEAEYLISAFHLSHTESLEILKMEADLNLFSLESLGKKINTDEILSRDKGSWKREFIKRARDYYNGVIESEIEYSSFPTIPVKREKVKVVEEDAELGFGRCPCPIDGEVTRCCKLRTLDVITQCAFQCTYCSVQAFYDQNRIKVVKNLKEKLNALSLSSDIWHIGTGQASDSLFLGDDYSTLSDLSDFASSHPDIVIELKSKASRDVFARKYPKNLIFTWSLNAPTVIEKEERGTASLLKRLECAEKARDNGSLIGFHIHPMVRFSGWKDEYSYVAKEIEKRFDPEDILMLSSGTLIFTKENLRFIREKGVKTRVLQMEKVPTAGKYSYPFEVKKEMFGHLFSSFSSPFISSIFTYLCLEDPRLWLPVLKREYNCDKDFEMDMRKKYLEKIRKHRSVVLNI